MVRSVFATVMLISAHSAFASMPIEKLKCLADTGGSQRVEISVKQTLGSAPEEKTDYKGNKVAVGFYPGNQFESQQILTIELNGYKSEIYDPGKSLYILEAPNSVKIQCYFE